MRKIKSVKLAKDYLTASAYCPAGTVLIPNGDFWMAKDTNGNKIYRNLAFHISDILESTVGLFTIEYEPEGFEFKKFLEGFEFKKFNEDFPEIYFCSQLNRLADWCDRQSEKDKDEAILYFAIYANPKNELKISSFMFTINQGLKFNSQKSAKLFLSELNKPENSDYKNYFINLLKKTRL